MRALLTVILLSSLCYIPRGSEFYDFLGEGKVLPKVSTPPQPNATPWNEELANPIFCFSKPCHRMASLQKGTGLKTETGKALFMKNRRVFPLNWLFGNKYPQ